jgi:LysM repeat protein
MYLKHLLIILAMTFSYTALAQQREHTVERGETLASIAKKYGLTEEQLRIANPNMTMCFTGVRLVIPDPNAPASVKEKTKDGSDDKKKKDKSSEEAADSTKKDKKINNVIKTIGNVAAAVVVSKIKGDSWYEAINNAIESADSTMKGGTNEHGFNSLCRKRIREKETVNVDATKKSTDKTQKTLNEPKEEEKDPELEALYNEYKAKYDEYIGQLEKIKSVFSKANDVAKRRTWKNVSETVKNYKTQLKKFRTECEMYTGKEIVASELESWVPVAPPLNAK